MLNLAAGGTTYKENKKMRFQLRHVETPATHRVAVTKHKEDSMATPEVEEKKVAVKKVALKKAALKKPTGSAMVATRAIVLKNEAPEPKKAESDVAAVAKAPVAKVKAAPAKVVKKAAPKEKAVKEKVVKETRTEPSKSAQKEAQKAAARAGYSKNRKDLSTDQLLGKNQPRKELPPERPKIGKMTHPRDLLLRARYTILHASLQELAMKADRSVTLLNQYERGEDGDRCLSPETAFALAKAYTPKALGVTPFVFTMLTIAERLRGTDLYNDFVKVINQMVEPKK